MHRYLLPAIFVMGLLMISFFSGAALTYSKYFPYPLIHQVQLGAVAWYENQVKVADEDDVQLKTTAKKADLENWELVKNEPGASAAGYTLACSILHPSAYLLDMQGKVAHSWSLLPQQEQFKKRQRIEDAYLFPNGDLLAAYIIRDGNTDRRALAKLDKDSRVLWEYKADVHHEVTVGEDGRIYVLIDPTRNDKPKDVPFINTPYLQDQIAILTPEGKEIEHISLLEAFAGSPYSHLLKHINVNNPKGDYTHNNNIEVLPTALAGAYPMFKPGYLLVSLRELDTVAVIDPQTKRVVWAQRGPWLGQHDPDFMPNGHVMVFDNRGRGDGNSRIIEVNIQTGKTVNMWGPAKGLKFATHTRGRQQVLANGNMLVSASNQSRLLEWKAVKGIVWEIKNPHFYHITCTSRFTPQELPFLKR